MKKIIPALFLMCFLFSFSGIAQKKTGPIKPKISTTLNGIRDSSVITVDDAIKFIAMPISILDDKKGVYRISSYMFMYVRKGVTEDEATGKVSPITSNVSAIFKTTPLSPIWIKTIQEQVKPGEELFFVDIIVKDGAGKLFYAPTLRLLVK
ncbi:MAG: hypothetical protein ABIY51_03585 [Ferruginibacter sp.]